MYTNPAVPETVIDESLFVSDLAFDKNEALSSDDNSQSRLDSSEMSSSNSSESSELSESSSESSESSTALKDMPLERLQSDSFLFYTQHRIAKKIPSAKSFPRPIPSKFTFVSDSDSDSSTSASQSASEFSVVSESPLDDFREDLAPIVADIIKHAPEYEQGRAIAVVMLVFYVSLDTSINLLQDLLNLDTDRLNIRLIQSWLSKTDKKMLLQLAAQFDEPLLFKWLMSFKRYRKLANDISWKPNDSLFSWFQSYRTADIPETVDYNSPYTYHQLTGVITHYIVSKAIAEPLIMDLLLIDEFGARFLDLYTAARNLWDSQITELALPFMKKVIAFFATRNSQPTDVATDLIHALILKQQCVPQFMNEVADYIVNTAISNTSFMCFLLNTQLGSILLQNLQILSFLNEDIELRTQFWSAIGNVAKTVHYRPTNDVKIFVSNLLLAQIDEANFPVLIASGDNRHKLLQHVSLGFKIKLRTQIQKCGHVERFYNQLIQKFDQVVLRAGAKKDFAIFVMKHLSDYFKMFNDSQKRGIMGNLLRTSDVDVDVLLYVNLELSSFIPKDHKPSIKRIDEFYRRLIQRFAELNSQVEAKKHFAISVLKDLNDYLKVFNPKQKRGVVYNLLRVWDANVDALLYANPVLSSFIPMNPEPSLRHSEQANADTKGLRRRSHTF